MMSYIGVQPIAGPYITFIARGGKQEENCLTFFEIVESVAV